MKLLRTNQRRLTECSRYAKTGYPAGHTLCHKVCNKLGKLGRASFVPGPSHGHVGNTQDVK